MLKISCFCMPRNFNFRNKEVETVVMEESFVRDLSTAIDWDSPEQAMDTLERFCIALNYHFQGEDCDVEMGEIW